ncbi:MAG: hypothetical protein WD876_02310 [Candidatus Pacearchaeota archaeon]
MGGTGTGKKTINKEKDHGFFYPSIFPRSRKAAIEMSMTTFVTIVLVVIVMVLAIFFIQRIFDSGKTAIDGIDAKIQSEINKLFAGGGKKIVVYPTEREIKIPQGDSGGFGFSIENQDPTRGVFSYTVKASEISSECRSQMTLIQADNLIELGASESGIDLGSGQELEQAIFVKFAVPETAPLCLIRYRVDVGKKTEGYTSTDGYTSTSVDLRIV